MIRQFSGLTATVYRPAGFPDTTNNGVSFYFNSLEIRDVTDRDHIGMKATVYLGYCEKREQWGAFPIASAAMKYQNGGHGGFMFGGNFIYCSDGRFPTSQPIKIFDRQE